MSPEIVDILSSIHRFQLINAMYEQRMINQDNYREYLLGFAKEILNIREEGSNGNEAIQGNP